MKIKICGNTSVEQLKQLQDLGADYAGMIFYERSKRYFGERIKNEKLEIKNLEIKKIGVFVNADFETIINAIEDYGLYAVQLHGDETDEFCLELMDKVQVVKVFRISGQENINELIQPFENVCHYFLFDTDTSAFGGSGKQFDWTILQNAQINKSFFLSGGIDLDDVDKIKKFQHSNFYAVDINSKFEKDPGNKDMNKVQQFINGMHNG
jgi:phosphoribosylanthranilate isomerase